LIGAIVAVATIGGLLFGYDSGAVNGTQPGLQAAFALDEAGLGFTVGSLLIGCFIGAFFAGMILGETSLSRRATEETLPLRDAFAVLFFVSVGMLFNPAVLIEQPLVLA
ncbi:cation:proton antiporter, partial [Escherichia coli]